MITKERLEELIEQGAKVWCICDFTYSKSKQNKKIEYYDLSNENICMSPAEFRDYGLRIFDALGYWNDIRFEFLFETKEEAEWYREFGCIERTERLELPTWEEFDKKGYIEFVGKEATKLILEKTLTIDYDREPISYYVLEILIDDYNHTLLFEAEYTKENYTLACRKCKELFLGE